MDNKEWLARIKKLYNKKVYHKPKVTNIKLIFQEFRRNKFYGKTIVTEQQFYAIIREVNQLLVEQLCQGLIIKIPYGLGSIESFKFNTTVKFKDGKLKVTRPVDWKETLKLWQSDENCYRNKTLIRREWKTLIKIEWNRLGCRCKNIKYFSFKPARSLVHKLNVLYRQGLIDTFIK